MSEEQIFTVQSTRSRFSKRWKLWLIHILILCMFSEVANSSPPYSVANLDASLAASCAQGTIVAIRSNDGIVLFTMTPKDTEWNAKAFESNDISLKVDSMETEEDEEIPLVPMTSRGFTCSPSLKVLQERQGLVISVTGFASDCNYFSRYAAGAVSEHEFIYGGVPLECQAIVRETLSPLLREATMGSGNRPLGIQAMVIGGGKVVDHGEQTIATLDPSGNIRYWNRHAVIGKQAAVIKKYLEKCTKTDNCNTSQILQWQDALKLGLSTIVESMRESDNLDESSLERFVTGLDCFVIFKQSSPCFGKCANVKRRWISRTFRKVYRDKTKTKT